MRRWLVGVLALIALTGCSASVAGRGTAAPPALCPAAGQDAGKVVSCLVDDLNRSWAVRIGRSINARVTVDPAAASVHRNCRAFLAFGTAFYCPPDDRIYLTAASVTRDRAAFGDRLPYALAAVVAHEVGHRVQFTVRQPELDRDGNAASRAVEQQADCLAGSWAYGAARRGLIDPGGLRAAYAKEMQLVSALTPPPGSGLGDYDEVATHGTPAERAAAFARGDTGTDPRTACGLA
jgi:predicted metalloprotease